jgi:guanine deaminase
MTMSIDGTGSGNDVALLRRAVQLALENADAEVAAIRAACISHVLEDLAGATVVSSCEPCAMCHAACAVAGVTRILYAAPKELVPGIESTPPLLARMQETLRELTPDDIVHVPTPGADEPFARFVERSGGCA